VGPQNTNTYTFMKTQKRKYTLMKTHKRTRGVVCFCAKTKKEKAEYLDAGDAAGPIAGPISECVCARGTVGSICGPVSAWASAGTGAVDGVRVGGSVVADGAGRFGSGCSSSERGIPVFLAAVAVRLCFLPPLCIVGRRREGGWRRRNRRMTEGGGGGGGGGVAASRTSHKW